ncbi:MAG: hypothetical protein KJO31_09855 [Gammaproteobacteria bacterium]|nr:hypothetical protein [Gammaproteobacteria bacterium]
MAKYNTPWLVLLAMAATAMPAGADRHSGATTPSPSVHAESVIDAGRYLVW